MRYGVRLWLTRKTVENLLGKYCRIAFLKLAHAAAREKEKTRS
jgi:hypothetical protein